MPIQKDFKRLVRARMRKTGESYTSARAQLLSDTPAPTSKSAPAPRGAEAAGFAMLAGMSDAAIKAKTGCTWERWVYALDKAGAASWPHREIAAYVGTTYKVGSWWSQTVTVGYERIKGLRVIGQRRGGDFSANKSRTFAAPLTRLYRACADGRQRARWLPGVTPTVRSTLRNKSVRMTWPDGTNVEIGFAGKGRGKAQLQVQHSGLPDKSRATAMKEFWAERLAALAGVVEE